MIFIKVGQTRPIFIIYKKYSYSRKLKTSAGVEPESLE